MKEQDEKINWLKYLLAITLIGGLTVTYIALDGKSLGLSVRELSLQIIPNLVASLLVVIVVYYFLIRKGISSEFTHDKSIINKISNFLTDNEFSSQLEVDKKFDLKKRLPNTKELLVLGYSCRFLVSSVRAELVEALKDRINVKILVVGPESNAAKMMIEYNNSTEIEFDVNELKRKLISIINQARTTSKRKRIGEVELRYIDWIPSSSLIFCIPKSEESPVVKWKVYAIHHATNIYKIKTHRLIYKHNNEKLYTYLLQQYNGIWERGVNEELE